MPLIITENKFNKPAPSLASVSKVLPFENIFITIAVISVAYNGVLAALLAHGMPIGPSIPAIVEFSLLLIAGLVILNQGLNRSSILPSSLTYFVVVISTFISIKESQIYVVPVRNFLIISIFTIVGGQCSITTVKKIFFYSCIIVLITLIFEVTRLDDYVKFFEPGRYFSLTRGMSESEYSGGLSAGTIAFKGRFSLGLYSGPRTSSIFLEQVSINCFAIVIAIYLMTFFLTLKKSEVTLYAGTVFLILATNNARMALIASIIFAVGYPIFPRLPNYLHVVLMPLIIASLFITFAMIPTAGGDDLVGRMTTTYDLLTSMDINDISFGSISGTARSFDSGYAFIIYSTTLLGLVFVWLYVGMVIPQVDALSRRCAWGISIYFSIWLLVGGTGTFSMKTAPLLWILVGFVRSQSLGSLKVLKEKRFHNGYNGHITNAKIPPAVMETHPHIEAR
jgi:hypothetical protein